MVFRGEDFTTRLMNQMDPELLDLVKTKVNSFIKCDLVLFLGENPNTADTAESIAKRIGRDAAAVEAELRELVQSGIMEVRQVEDMPIYSLTEDTHTRELLDRFRTDWKDRQFRVKVIYHIVRGMR